MDATAPLGHATLSDSLNAACISIAEAVIEGSHALGVEIPGVLTPGYLEEYIPGQAFNIAVNAGWLPTPHEPEDNHGIVLGDFYVEEKYREWFISLVDESLSKLREVTSKYADDEEAHEMKKGMFDVLLAYALQHKVRKRKGETGYSPSDASDTLVPEWAESYKKSRLVETTPDERKALEHKYLSTNEHPVYGGKYEMQELHGMANVHRKQWDRWRRGELANNSLPGRRILALLERNEATKKALKERTREGFRKR